MKKLNTFFIRTYGCQMNELDSEVMAGMLIRRGLTRTDDEDTADLLIFNTCSVRDLAERKVLGKVGQVAKKRENKPIIGITGCMANAKRETLLQKLPYVDFVVGPNNIHNLNDVLDAVACCDERVCRADKQFTNELDYEHASRNDSLKASVSIIRGCNKHCTYCIVPYTRGPEVSRPAEDIILECQDLVQKGYKEITLLGQNVNSYGKDSPTWNIRFHDLLYRIDKIPGICRVRFLTSHPCDITVDLMNAIRDLPSLCEFVHFPLQAGSNRILTKMNRGYTREEYLEKVSLLREIVPGVALGTDIIVGFPTETTQEFEGTVLALETIRFSTGFLFAYSPRKGTPATRWPDDVSEEQKEERLQTVLSVQKRVTQSLLQEYCQKTVEVLVEGTTDDLLLRGRTRTWSNVVFPGPKNLIGTLQQVNVHSTAHQTLVGELVYT